jgi:hypothetical protein
MSAACCEACSETTSFGVRKPSPSRATSTGMAKREDFLAYVTVPDHPAIGVTEPAESLNSRICFAAGLVSGSGRTSSLFHRSLLRGEHPRRWASPSFPRSNCHSLKTENRLLDLYKLLAKLGKYLPDIHDSILSIPSGFRNYGTSSTAGVFAGNFWYRVFIY